jgi:hypothetical protein
MMPALNPPYSVTVNVYLPLLTLSVGQAQVQGLWSDQSRLRPQAWRHLPRPPTKWRSLPKAQLENWIPEKP